jgi:hypothetical protein
MGILGDAIGRGESSGDRAAGAGASAVAPGLVAPIAPPVAPGASSPAAMHAQARSDLRRRRDALAEQVTELHWDLGGLAYEMAIRDHFRLDVLVRRAAVLQERDGELAELERLLRMEEGAVAGSCSQCAAPYSRGAVFCWQCGATLMESAASTAAAPQARADDPALDGQDDTTATLHALLGTDGREGSRAVPGADG